MENRQLIAERRMWRDAFCAIYSLPEIGAAQSAILADAALVEFRKRFYAVPPPGCHICEAYSDGGPDGPTTTCPKCGRVVAGRNAFVVMETLTGNPARPPIDGPGIIIDERNAEIERLRHALEVVAAVPQDYPGDAFWFMHNTARQALDHVVTHPTEAH